MQSLFEPGRHLGYQGLRMVPHPPTFCEKSARTDKLIILQVNIAGLRNKSDELLSLLKENGVQIALLKEAILPTNIVIATLGYSQYKCDCIKCQGIRTLIRLDTQAEVEKQQAGDLDLQRITAWLGKQKFTIYNATGQINLLHNSP